MSNYTQITVGGINLFVDPDTLSRNRRNLISIERSMSGDLYGFSYKSNTDSFDEELNISGTYLPESSAKLLLDLCKKKAPVEVNLKTNDDGGGGGQNTNFNYIILAVNATPIKPNVYIPNNGSNNTEVKYSYTITLRKVDDN